MEQVHRRLTWGWRETLWLLALCLQLIRTDTFFEYTNSDRNHQIQATANAQAGHGYSSAFAGEADLSRFEYERLSNWPLGYNLMIVPFYALTGDWFVSIESCHYLGIIALFLLMYAIWRALSNRISSRAAYLFLGFWAVSFAPFQYPGTTDLWAGLFVLFAGYCLLRGYEGGWNWMVAAVLALGAAMSMRYASYPFAVVPVIWLALTGRKKQAAWSLVLMALVMIPLIYLQIYQSGGARYTTFSPGNAAPYWEHLLQFDLIPLKAYCYVSISKLADMLRLPVLGLWSLLLVPSLAIVAMVAARWIREALRLFQPVGGDILSRWALFSLLVTGINVALLSYLSLRYQAEVYEHLNWTYVSESRYYLPVFILLQLWIPILVTDRETPLWVRRSLGFFLAGCVLFVLVHTGSRLYEYGSGSRRAAAGDTYERTSRAIHATATALAAQPDPIVYIYGANLLTDKMKLVAGWSGAASIPLHKLKPSVSSSQPVSLMAFLSPAEFAALQALPALLAYSDQWEKRYETPETSVYVLKRFSGEKVPVKVESARQSDQPGR